MSFPVTSDYTYTNDYTPAACVSFQIVSCSGDLPLPLCPTYGGFDTESDISTGPGTYSVSASLLFTEGCNTVNYVLMTAAGTSITATIPPNPNLTGEFDGMTRSTVPCASIPRAVSSSVPPAKSLGNPLDQSGCPCAGDPVTIATGNLFEQVADYSTFGSNLLRFDRFYNSAQAPSFAGTMGINWRTAYDRYIQIGSGSSVIVERPDGQQLTFNLTGGAWTTDSDVDLQLTNAGSTWILTDGDDTVETYSTISANEALLHSIRARNGYTQALSYNSSNQLVSVTDSYNRPLGFAYSNGLVKTVTTPDGLVLTYGYASSAPQLTSVSYSTTPKTTLTYVYGNSASPSSLTGIIDQDGNSYATWTYDSSNRVLASQHAVGADLTTLSYNDTTGTRTVINALNQATTYSFTTLQGVPKVASISRAATSTTAAATETFTYDTNGNTASVTDWNGNTTNYVNNSRGEPTMITEAAGTPEARTTTITYLSNFHLPSQIVTPGLTTNFTYDGSGNLLTKALVDTTTTSVPYPTNGQSRTWTYTWSNFLMASSKSPNGNATSFTYDGSGALTATTNALGQQTKITKHMPGGLPQTIVDPNGVTTSLAYDPRLRLLSSTLMAGAGPLVTSFSHDAAGNLLIVTLPDGSAITNTYDAAHRLTGIADLFHNGIAYTLDAAGDRTKTVVSNPGGIATRQHSATFDALGRPLHDIGGVGQTTVFGYDSNGNALAITDPLQRVTQQTFDALNRPIKITNPAQGNAAFTYDPHNRPLTVTDPKGNTTTYTYAGFGDVIQEASPARGTTVYHYDSDGNLTQKVDARGAVANSTYDELDRILTVAYPADSAENVVCAYDQPSGGFGIGRLTSVTDAVGSLNRTYDERGDMLSESRVSGTTTLLTTYTYDAASRVASIAYPSGWTVGYTRDAMGRTTAMTTKAPSASTPTTLLSNTGYEPFGPVNALTYGNGIAEARTFDLDYRLTNLTGTGNAPVQQLKYGYDAANNVLSIMDAVASGNSQMFSYDSLNRLVSAAGGYGSLGYTYDANGNRLTENPTTTVTPSPLDGIGTVSALTYNQANRLATVSAGTQQLTQYTYDAFGHRSVKLGTVTPLTIYQYDQTGDLLEEDNTHGNTRIDYVYLDGRPVAEISAGTLYFLHDDRLGTPQVATSATQSAVWIGNYQPFGALSASSQTALLAQDLRLPGQENDGETGLYHNGFRDYVPRHGRYLESDPIGLGGGLNTYAYARGNPSGFTDRLGLDITVNYYGGGAGHIGLSINGGPSYGYYGDGNPYLLLSGSNGGGSEELDYPNQGLPTATFTIQTTATEDSAAQNAIDALIDNPRNYSLYTNNCTVVAESILTAAGIPNVPSTIFPALLIPELQLYNEFLNLSGVISPPALTTP